MYESYFGLKTKPFDLTPNPEFLFPSGSHKQALNYLKYGLKEKAGFILLTGEVGSGKTTILRRMIKQLDHGAVLANIFNTRTNPEQLIYFINEEFGLRVAAEQSKVSLLRDLNDFLLTKYAQNVQPIVVVDEAQNLTADALEELRLLSNLETEDKKLIHIILSGQPELKKMLSRPELRQLRQRIGISCHLNPLSRKDVEDYVLFRLEKAGNRDAVTFDNGVFDIVHRASGGIPRLINIFCDYLLLTAFSEETRTIPCEMAEEVVGEVSHEVGGEISFDAPEPGLQRLERANRQISDNDFLVDTNRRLVELVQALEEQNRLQGERSEALRSQVDASMRSLQEHLKVIGGALNRITARLDKLTP